MSKESLLKKEFKEKDVQRIRNIVNKDFTSKVNTQVGYTKNYVKYKEGDIWEEKGKNWTIKNGLKQNITKLDSAKKSLRVPLRCPKCHGSMNHHLHKKMYKIHGFCFDCTIEYESTLKKTGLFEQYEKRMMSGNIKSFITDIENWVLGSIDDKQSFVTEQGDVESWSTVSTKYKEKVLKNLKEYLDIYRNHIS